MVTDAHDGPVPEVAGGGQRVLDLLDKAITLQSPLVRKNIARARQRNPEATPAEVIRNLERMYVSALTGTGAAVGGAAAAPGVGTGVALALSGGEFLSSLQLSALFALSIAEVHGVPIDEVERRRTIVMGIMLGGSGSATITKMAERTGQHWGRLIVGQVPGETLPDQQGPGKALHHEVRHETGHHRSRSGGTVRRRRGDRRWCQRSPGCPGRAGRPPCLRPTPDVLAW
ncbi:hypothetical protein [Micromonospora humidisoli]|uniref:EcsC protein family protein n=1 Tax=Micromonospora humidisoli TaxID=2807622 RepID=A0ABS2J952_9ACTN|nr:hypothetical protein [Micromonospora humidisoli]MBM7083027.1 hypothetical protein [Micromonospora humidisoli]